MKLYGFGRVAEMYAEYKKSFPEISDLSTEQVFKLMKRVEVVFVCVLLTADHPAP